MVVEVKWAEREENFKLDFTNSPNILGTLSLTHSSNSTHMLSGSFAPVCPSTLSTLSSSKSSLPTPPSVTKTEWILWFSLPELIPTKAVFLVYSIPKALLTNTLPQGIFPKFYQLLHIQLHCHHNKFHSVLNQDFNFLMYLRENRMLKKKKRCFSSSGSFFKQLQ